MKSQLKLLSITIILFHCYSNASALALLNYNDTINKQYFDSSSYTLYASPGGGYVAGNNAYGDLTKAQEFHVGNYCNIFGVILHFGYVLNANVNDSSYVGINFYHLNGTGRNSTSASAACPGSIFFQDSIKVSDIDVINGNILTYNNAIYTDSIFAIGIDFNGILGTDTIALYTNKDGDAGSREQSWEQDASGNWFTLKYNWPLNVDLAIFPIVNTSVGIGHISENRFKGLISPNPTHDGIININCNGTKVKSIQIYDVNLKEIPFQFIDDADNNLQIDIISKIKGTYFVKINTEDRILMNKIILQ